MRKNSLSALTGARFFAALYVLTHHVFVTDFHVMGLMVNAWPKALTNIFDRGCVAVNFFFVLSGFILAYNYSSAQGEMACTKRDFWAARFARIWPMFAVGLLLALPLFLRSGLYEESGMGVAKVMVAAVTHLAANLFLLNAWVPGWNDINGPGWSLSVEAFFYLVFPFALLAVGRLSNQALFRVAVGLYLLSLLPTLLFSYWFPGTTHFYDWTGAQLSHKQMTNTLYWFPPFRLPDFLVGMALGIGFNRASEEKERSLATNSLLALGVFVVALAFMESVPWPVLRSSFYTPLSAWLIWSLARRPEALLAKALAWSPMLLLGEASYGMYLFHLTILRALKIALAHFGYELSISSPLLLWTLTLLIVLPLSIALFWFVEEPARKYLRKKLTSPRPVQKLHPVGTEPSGVESAPQKLSGHA